jgi:crotonobetainyl-CoA:carnitine CoA-transferase CaiB-like acyl-CoA transferase
MVLADLGAEVVKVEPPEGDPTRGWGPPWVGEGRDRTAAYFLSVNRNKRSVVLDLRSRRGSEALRRLLAGANVFIENFRPGALAALGFDDEALRALRPDLIHLSISGYGTVGPDAAKPGYDFVAQAVGGLMSVTGPSDAEGGGPTKVGVAISDVVAGLFGAIGVLAELASVGVRENGARVDVSLLESTFAVLINQAQNAFVTGASPARRGNSHPNIVPYEAFATADRPIVVAVGSERQWPRFCEALGLSALTDDPRFATNADRVTNRDTLRPVLEARFATRRAAEWLATLDAADVPCGPINDVLTAFGAPQAEALDASPTIRHPVLGDIRLVGSPVRLGGASTPPRRPPPLLGEHTAEVLAELSG